MSDEYELNGVVANLKYGNKDVELRGLAYDITIKSWSLTKSPYYLDRYTLRLGTPNEYAAYGVTSERIYCILPSLAQAASIIKGNNVTVFGTVDGQVYLDWPNDIVLYPCRLGSAPASAITPASTPTPAPTSGLLGTINFGELKSGSIVNVSETDMWNFTAARGEGVTISVKAITGNLNPFLTLKLADGTAVTDDDGIDGTNPLIQNLYLNCSGTYQIVISAWAGTYGDYQLEFSLVPEGSSYNVRPC